MELVLRERSNDGRLAILIYLHVPDIVDIIVVEERDALESQKRLQTMPGIGFKQSAE